MRSKSPNRSWLNLGFAASALLASASASALSFDPYGAAGFPNQKVDDGDGTTSTVYYLDNPGYAGTVSTAAGYTRHGFTTNELFPFAIAGASADVAKQYTWIYAETTTDGEYKPIPIANCSVPNATLGSCNQGTTDAFVIYLNFTNICATVSNIKGCSGGNVNVTAPITGFRLRALLGVSTAPGTAAAASGTQLKVIPQIDPPTLTAVPADPGFFPGDTSVFVETGQLVATANTNSGSSPVFLRTFVVAQQNGSVPTPETGATVVQAVAYGSGRQEISGFENSTNDGGLVPYEMKLGVEDSAGALVFTNAYANVFATDIQGFLRESNCFVATASYRDGRAPGVMLLRNFRDEVLSRFSLGRAFVDGYYRYGPVAADWLLDHPIFRSVSLLLLLPVQAAAWVALNPLALLLPLFALLVFLGFAFRGGAALGLALVTFLASAPKATAEEASASRQPYIDSLISELPPEATRTDENPDPYIQSIKRKLPRQSADEIGTGYTEEMRRQIGSKDGSEGYTDRIQRGLPKTSGSAIEDYRKGKKLRANKGSLDTRSAFGFNLMASGTRTFTSGEYGDLEYGTVYGDDWVPDFLVHFEWRPFTGDFMKKFGLYTSLGASFTKAQGVLNYQDARFGSESQTEFRFIMLPANVGLIYRFSLFDFMWPYFAGGPSAIGFIENRKDKQAGNRGYTFGYWFTGGIALGLDWLSPKSSWDQYETAGIKHSYFSIEYNYLESVAGGLVEFTVDGVRAGFTFEL